MSWLRTPLVVVAIVAGASCGNTVIVENSGDDGETEIDEAGLAVVQNEATLMAECAVQVCGNECD